MKGITLYQPHATLVSINAKKIESRPWETSYRGMLAIHAAKKSPENYLQLFWEESFYSVLTKAGYTNPRELPCGRILATSELVTCHRVDGSDWLPDQRGWSHGKYFWEATDQEKAFGNYAVGRFMWMLANTKQLEEPIFFKGAQGLFYVPDDIIREKRGSLLPL